MLRNTMQVKTSVSCNIYIPIGGIGSRLRNGLKTFTLPSKCFIEDNGITLLELIVARTSFIASAYYVVYCYDEQYTASYNLLGNSYQGIPVIYVRNSSTNPYACLPTDGNCLAVMGDTFAPESTFREIVSYGERENKIAVLRLEPEIRSQPKFYYLHQNNLVIDYSQKIKTGYESFDIGQVLYFPNTLVKDCLEKAVTIDPISMLHDYIKTSGIVCLDLPCININTVEDFHRAFN